MDTVYFGGGTPTLLSADQLEELLSTVRASYSVSPDAEITAECNPATADRIKLLRMRRAGINRLSIGLQSANQRELQALGRCHSFADFMETWQNARAAGFDNLSADVMSGIPYQTPESWLFTLEQVCSLCPEHLSAYGLTIEDGTPFARRKAELPLPDEESARKMYFDGIRFLSDRGFRQYEISNYARPGYESRHNLKYWNCEPYLGFGPAAYSDFQGVRFGNLRDLAAYTDSKDITAERESPSLWERANEYVMLRLRLSDGVSVAAFEARFGGSFAASFGNALERYVPGGFVRKMPDGYALTPEGMYVSNSILSDILDFPE